MKISAPTVVESLHLHNHFQVPSTSAASVEAFGTTVQPHITTMACTHTAPAGHPFPKSYERLNKVDKASLSYFLLRYFHLEYMYCPDVEEADTELPFNRGVSVDCPWMIQLGCELATCGIGVLDPWMTRVGRDVREPPRPLSQAQILFPQLKELCDPMGIDCERVTYCITRAAMPDSFKYTEYHDACRRGVTIHTETRVFDPWTRRKLNMDYYLVDLLQPESKYKTYQTQVSERIRNYINALSRLAENSNTNCDKISNRHRRIPQVGFKPNRSEECCCTVRDAWKKRLLPRNVMPLTRALAEQEALKVQQNLWEQYNQPLLQSIEVAGAIEPPCCSVTAITAGRLCIATRAGNDYATYPTVLGDGFAHDSCRKLERIHLDELEKLYEQIIQDICKEYEQALKSERWKIADIEKSYKEWKARAILCRVDNEALKAQARCLQANIEILMRANKDLARGKQELKNRLWALCQRHTDLEMEEEGQSGRANASSLEVGFARAVRLTRGVAHTGESQTSVGLSGTRGEPSAVREQVSDHPSPWQIPTTAQMANYRCTLQGAIQEQIPAHFEPSVRRAFATLAGELPPPPPPPATPDVPELTDGDSVTEDEDGEPIDPEYEVPTCVGGCRIVN